jgi:phosphoglucosamine mutase
MILSLKMKRQFFGTDGVRGKVGQHPITPDFMLRLANAVGQHLTQTIKRPLVVIGKDTRISGYMLESSLEAGFNSVGVDVVLLGPMPTPGVAYLTQALRANLGVVISASHNPFEDNGVKFFNAQGHKLPDQWEFDVEQRLSLPPQWVTSAQIGKTRRLDDAVGRYVEFCKSTVANDLSLNGLKLVVDAAHGAAYVAAPKVFQELGAQVITVGCSPDGLNINQGVGATHPETLKQAVLQHQADFGIALDGDADRVQMADAKGRLFNGDELLYVLTQHRLSLGQKVPGVVGTLMTNQGVEIALRELGVPLARANVGDRYVLEQLQEQQWLLGGEGSGHMLILDKHSSGDGIISGLQVLQACLQTKQSLAQILSKVNLSSQCLVNVRLKTGVDWQTHASFQATKSSIEQSLGSLGRVLIRPSGTEPVLRIMVEATQASVAHECAHRLAECLTE